MKSLNLNAYGVSEMSMAQMREVEGGCWICDFVAACAKAIMSFILH